MLKHLSEAKRMSGEERLRNEQWRRVGMLGSLRERRSEEMTQLNISLHGVRNIFRVSEGDGS